MDGTGFDIDKLLLYTSQKGALNEMVPAMRSTLYLWHDSHNQHAQKHDFSIRWMKMVDSNNCAVLPARSPKLVQSEMLLLWPFIS